MLSAHNGWRRIVACTAGLLVTVVLSTSQSLSAPPSGPSPVLISQTPMTISIPAHPQIVFALANSQSMDGDLSGAIMTGSGQLGGVVGTDLGPSSSPANYTVPGGFTPPVNAGSAGQAPYTVNSSGTLIDNSASRLNVAKAGINAILNSFMEYADFSLMDYTTGNLGEYTTWVYYMSPSTGDFTFTSTPGPSDYVANPCYNADVTQLDAYSQSCAALQTDFGAVSGVITQPYMIIGATSDDPLINDVFYAQAGYQPPVCTDGVPSNLNPYSLGLSAYENGGVQEFYGVQWGTGGYTWQCAPGMTPTNAGFVPFSPQVMQVMRGFGYDASTQSATTGTLLVPMQSSGNAPTPATVASAIGAFTAYLQPETSDPSTTEVKAVAEQSPTAGLVQSAAQYLGTETPSSSNNCTPAQYIVLVTDGLPTKDLSGNSWPPLGTASATGYGVTATFNSDGSLNVASTNDGALTDAIGQITAAAGHGIKTYVIGLGAGVDPGNNMYASKTLTAMAVAGNTGSYFAADSPADLTMDMQVILAQILKAVRSTSSATVNTTGLNSSSMAFQPSFNTSDVDQDWTGDIKAYPIDAGTGTVSSTLAWSAQAQLDAQASGSGWTSRLIATWDPATGKGIPFEWDSANPMSGIGLDTTLGVELESNTSDPNGQDALDYLRGDSQLSLDVTGGVYRNRTHILGDIVDSAPVYVAAAVGPYQTVSYYNFERTNANRAPVLYVGANDGMLHAFSATTGQELFAYIPAGVFPNLIQLTNPYYNETHHFFVDGSPQVADVQFNSGVWRTILVGSERAGGNDIYALDVTDPSSIHTENDLKSDVLWDFSDANMGMGFSTPAIAQTAVGASGGNLGFTVFFGNGYNSTAQTPYLYALDPQTGDELAGTPIDLCSKAPGACNSALPNGLSSVQVTNNLGSVGTAATTVYAGDLQGNLWRVDIRDPNPLNWTVSLLFQARDPSSGSPQPITTTPAVSLNPDFPRLAGTMVYVGTGQLLGATDLSTTQIQTMYGVYDSGSNPMTLRRGDLLSQCLTESLDVASGKTLRFVNGGQVNLASDYGWAVDFDVLGAGTPSNPCGVGPQTDVGERIVSDPRLIGGALVVISVEPQPYTGTTSMTLGSRSHANLAKATLPPASSAAAPAVASPLDPAVYLRTGALGGQSLSPTRARAMDGVLYTSGSSYNQSSAARLWPVGFGTGPQPTLVSIAVTPPNQTITQGQTEEYTATGTYTDGSMQNLTTQVSWSSSDTSVATIGSQGLASSLATGSSGITATLGSISGSTGLTVIAPPPPPPPPTLVSITVTPANQTIDVGQTEQYTATGTYSDGSTLNLTAEVTWTSTTTSVATIASGGLASAVAAGSTTIGATLDSVSGSTTLTVVPVPVQPPVTDLESITVSPPSPTIYVGQTQQYTATAHYNDGSSWNVTTQVTWSSSNTAVGTIAAGGLATGSMAGATTITATLGGISGSATLTVENRPPPPTLQSITVTPTATIYVGQTQQFTATGHYSDGSSANLTSLVTWSSLTTAVATIGSGGLATGVAPGTSVITAAQGSVSGTALLTVENRPPPPTLVSISVTPPNQTIDVGQGEQYTATGHYTDGSTQNLTSVVSWSSSIPSVASIVSGGLATSAAIGSTTITASDGSVSGNTGLIVVATPAPPPPPVCPGGDVSYLMEFNFAGGAFNNPVFNYEGPGAITSAIIPANGVLLGGVYASAPVFNNYSGGSYGTGGDIGLVTLGGSASSPPSIEPFFQAGLHQQRYSWWEIR
jgi:type IV pilus assembly protein PilY1